MNEFSEYLNTLPSTPFNEAVREGYRVICESEEPNEMETIVEHPVFKQIVENFAKCGIKLDPLDPLSWDAEKFKFLAGIQHALVVGGGFDFDSLLSYGKFVDRRDGREYRTIRSNGLEWMAAPIDYFVRNVDEYERQGFATHTSNTSFYTYEGVGYVTPGGWRVPTEKEWSSILQLLGGNPDAIGLDMMRALGFDLKLDGYYTIDNNSRGSQYKTVNKHAGEYASLWCRDNSRRVDKPCMDIYSDHVEFTQILEYERLQLICVRNIKA